MAGAIDPAGPITTGGVGRSGAGGQGGFRTVGGSDGGCEGGDERFGPGQLVVARPASPGDAPGERGECPVVPVSLPLPGLPFRVGPEAPVAALWDVPHRLGNGKT